MLKEFREDLKHFDKIRDPIKDRSSYALFGFHAISVYRFGRWILGRKRNSLFLHNISFCFYPIYWALNAYIRKAYDIQIDLTADIGPGLYIGHFGGITVQRCRLGHSCSIHQGVYVGPRKDDFEGPVIGERVWIGPHARVVGRVKIANGVTIGPGAKVTNDIEHQCLIMGNPARIIKRKYDNSSFL